jgi:hypothetical protein
MKSLLPLPGFERRFLGCPAGSMLGRDKQIENLNEKLEMNMSVEFFDTLVLFSLVADGFIWLKLGCYERCKFFGI